ncbi:MAG: tetratricopeptide repeat protein, partial [Elusimicrobia bacterium]|nr:tetratricopeptide repeat protein [Elusimicrobiota bacterium]
MDDATETKDRTPAAAGADPAIVELVRRGREQRLLNDVSNFEEGVPLLREAVEAAPDHAPAYAELSQTYAAWGLRRENGCLGFRRETRRTEFQNLYDMAYEYAAMSLRLSADLGASHRAMAMALRRGAKADPERRAKEALLAVELDPDDPENACERWRAQGYDPDDKGLRATLEEHPELVGVRLDLAESLVERGRYDEAMHELRQALHANPRNLQAYYDVAMLLDRQNERAKAREVLGRASRLRPGDPLIEQGRVLL